MKEQTCNKCGHKAQFIQGVTTFDRIEQYHCPHCHNTFICTGNGKFLKEGHIAEHWYDTGNGYNEVIYYIEEVKK